MMRQRQAYNNSLIVPHSDSSSGVIFDKNFPPLHSEDVILNETPILKGSVVYSDSASGRWGKAWNLLGSMLHSAAMVAKAYSDALAKIPTTTICMPSMTDLNYEPTNIHLDANQNPVSYRQINTQPSQALGVQAANRVGQLQAQTNRLALKQAHQHATHLLTLLAQTQELPTYQEFQAKHRMVYPAPPELGSLGLAPIKPQTNSNRWIQEDQQQIQANLQAAQTPQKLLAMQAKSQIAQQQAFQTRKIAWQTQARQTTQTNTNNAKLENDFKAEINSKLETQMEEMFSLNHLPDPFITRKKELEFSNYIFKNYLLGKDGKIHPLNGYQLADIIDYIAHHTRTDVGFKTVLWGLFGATIPDEHTPLLTRFVDRKNPGLQDKYLNDGYDQEQMHHYLGGVTGDFYDSNKKITGFGLHSKNLMKFPEQVDGIKAINFFFSTVNLIGMTLLKEMPLTKDVLP